MPLDLAVNITTAGCQLSAVVSSHNKVTGERELELHEADELLLDATHILETIKYTSNLRMLETYNFAQYFEPGIWQRIVQVLEVWSGRLEPGQVIANWDAIREENAELEAGRQRYAENQMVMALHENSTDHVATTSYSIPDIHNCPRCNVAYFASDLEHSEKCDL